MPSTKSIPNEPKKSEPRHRPKLRVGREDVEDEFGPSTSARDPATNKCRYCGKEHAFFLGIDSDYWC